MRTFSALRWRPALVLCATLSLALTFSEAVRYDVDQHYVDVEGPKRQDETSRDKTRRAGHVGVMSEETGAHIAKSLEILSEHWKDGRTTVDTGASGQHGEQNSLENNNGNNYAQYGETADLQPFDKHKKVGDAYFLPHHFSSGASQELETQNGGKRTLNPFKTVTQDEVESADQWRGTRDEPASLATLKETELVDKIEADKPPQDGLKGRKTAILGIVETIDKIDAEEAGEPSKTAQGATSAAAFGEVEKEDLAAARKARAADDQREEKAIRDAERGGSGYGNAAAMRADAARVAAQKRAARRGRGPCGGGGLRSDECTEECEIGAWKAVEALMEAGIVLGDRTHPARGGGGGDSGGGSGGGGGGGRDRGRGDRANALSNINDAVHGVQARRSAYGSAPGGFTCLSPSIARALLRVAEVFRGVKVRVSALAGGEHGEHMSHYQGRAVDISAIAGVPLSRAHAKIARAVAKACLESGASAVYNVNLDCGEHCEHHTKSVHCAFPVDDPVAQDSDIRRK